MKAIMIGYWVILVGLVLDVVGTVWDAIDDLTGEEAGEEALGDYSLPKG